MSCNDKIVKFSTRHELLAWYNIYTVKLPNFERPKFETKIFVKTGKCLIFDEKFISDTEKLRSNEIKSLSMNFCVVPIQVDHSKLGSFTVYLIQYSFQSKCWYLEARKLHKLESF